MEQMIYFRNYVTVYLKECVSVYFSIFYSHVIYGCLVWSYSTQRNIDRIIKLWKRCILIITYLEFTEHTGPLFFELKLLKVKDIFSLTKLLLMFDFINKKNPKNKKQFLSLTDLHTHMKLVPQWHSIYQKLKRCASV